MFQGGVAQEAIDFYIDLLPNSRIDDVQRFGDANPNAPELIMFATVTLSGQKIFFSDSPIEHAFDFTPSTSLFVECSSEDEIDGLFPVLSEGGKVLMPLDSYEFGKRFAWVEDRYGVSWQLIFR